MRIVSLFDYTGLMTMPWTFAGHWTCLVDWRHEEGDPHPLAMEVRGWDLRDEEVEGKIAELRPDVVFSFPDCTHLAVSGVRHWRDKERQDLYFQARAVDLCRLAERVGSRLNIPWFVENPTGALQGYWRRPDFIFHPYEYGGYLRGMEEHPFWPKYIAPSDAYPKATGLWFGNGFVPPEKRPVEPEPGYSRQMQLLGGKRFKTKVIRSATPRGFAYAVFSHCRPG